MSHCTEILQPNSLLTLGRSSIHTDFEIHCISIFPCGSNNLWAICQHVVHYFERSPQLMKKLWFQWGTGSSSGTCISQHCRLLTSTTWGFHWPFHNFFHVQVVEGHQKNFLMVSAQFLESTHDLFIHRGNAVPDIPDEQHCPEQCPYEQRLFMDSWTRITPTFLPPHSVLFKHRSRVTHGMFMTKKEHVWPFGFICA